MKNKARMIEKKYGQEGFNYLFEIDKDSNLLWKNPTASCVKPGTVAGTIATRGYRQVMIEGVGVMVHRIIWIMRHGEIPDGLQINHIDLNKLNNEDTNMELVTNAVNCRRKGVYKCNKSGYTGVSWHKKQSKWIARAKNVDGTSKWLGSFDTPEEAYLAVQKYKNELLEQFGEEYKYLN